MNVYHIKKMTKTPVCQRCMYFYVTHEPAMPYGCRAMHFKSAQNPAQVVLSSSGIECQLFTLKDANREVEKKSLPKRVA